MKHYCKHRRKYISPWVFKYTNRMIHERTVVIFILNCYILKLKNALNNTLLKHLKWKSQTGRKHL